MARKRSNHSLGRFHSSATATGGPHLFSRWVSSGGGAAVRDRMSAKRFFSHTQGTAGLAQPLIFRKAWSSALLFCPHCLACLACLGRAPIFVQCFPRWPKTGLGGAVPCQTVAVFMIGSEGMNLWQSNFTRSSPRAQRRKQKAQACRRWDGHSGSGCTGPFARSFAMQYVRIIAHREGFPGRRPRRKRACFLGHIFGFRLRQRLDANTKLVASKPGLFLTFPHADFGFVSDFELRISDFRTTRSVSNQASQQIISLHQRCTKLR